MKKNYTSYYTFSKIDYSIRNNVDDFLSLIDARFNNFDPANQEKQKELQIEQYITQFEKLQQLDFRAFFQLYNQIVQTQIAQQTGYCNNYCIDVQVDSERINKDIGAVIISAFDAVRTLGTSGAQTEGFRRKIKYCGGYIPGSSKNTDVPSDFRIQDAFDTYTTYDDCNSGSMGAVIKCKPPLTRTDDAIQTQQKQQDQKKKAESFDYSFQYNDEFTNIFQPFTKTSEFVNYKYYIELMLGKDSKGLFCLLQSYGFNSFETDNYYDVESTQLLRQFDQTNRTQLSLRARDMQYFMQNYICWFQTSFLPQFHQQIQIPMIIFFSPPPILQMVPNVFVDYSK